MLFDDWKNFTKVTPGLILYILQRVKLEIHRFSTMFKEDYSGIECIPICINCIIFLINIFFTFIVSTVPFTLIREYQVEAVWAMRVANEKLTCACAASMPHIVL